MDLDQALLEQLDEAAASSRLSRNTLILNSVRRHLRLLERERIDREFQLMAEDQHYQAEMLVMDGEWSSASEAAWAQLEP